MYRWIKKYEGVKNIRTEHYCGIYGKEQEELFWTYPEE